MSNKVPKERIPRRARVERVIAVYLRCPACGTDLEAPSGSLLWLEEDLDKESVLTCTSCDQTILIPHYDTKF